MKKDTVNKNRSIKRLCITAAACAICAVISAGAVLGYYFAPRGRETKIVTVPNLVGECEDSISLPDGIVLERDYVYSNEADAGAVISQSPVAHSKRKLGRGEDVNVKITVSLGKKTGEIPDVCGMPYVKAALKLREIGAQVSAVSVYDADADAGTVISTDPPEKTQIGEGDKVIMYVARKRVRGSVKVPNLLGMESAEAITRLLSQGLALGNIDYVIADGELCGRVIRQSAEAGAYVKDGTKIDLSIGYDPETRQNTTDMNFGGDCP